MNLIERQMLAPAAVLVVWTLVMATWMMVSRLTAFGKVPKDVAHRLFNTPGGRGQDMQGILPDRVMWKSHNYTHLLEQPTIYYPTVVILALTGAGLWDVRLAWAYTGIRVVHSLWQANVNLIAVRAPIFFLSSFCLIALAIRAVMATLQLPLS